MRRDGSASFAPAAARAIQVDGRTVTGTGTDTPPLPQPRTGNGAPASTSRTPPPTVVEPQPTETTTTATEIVSVEATRVTVVNALDQSNASLMGDAPACDTCGAITVRNGSCYKCLNCGASMGCS